MHRSEDNLRRKNLLARLYSRSRINLYPCAIHTPPFVAVFCSIHSGNRGRSMYPEKPGRQIRCQIPSYHIPLRHTKGNNLTSHQLVLLFPCTTAVIPYLIIKQLSYDFVYLASFGLSFKLFDNLGHHFAFIPRAFRSCLLDYPTGNCDNFFS